MEPKVTVLMSVYNGERYLREAIDSILNQTLTNFEFLIIDDASTDSTQKIIQCYEDPRIKRIRNCENLGLTKSLNNGIKLAKGEYIARMDADDISYPQRLEKQLFFLERNPDIGISGTWVSTIDENGRIVGSEKFPVYPETIKISIIFGYSVVHPSVMMRKDIINSIGGYNEKYRFAQDYDLWIRCLRITKISNCPDVLLKYRIHSVKISKVQRPFQLDTSLERLDGYLKENFNLTLEKKMLILLLQSDSLDSISDFRNVIKIIDQILSVRLQGSHVSIFIKLELMLCIYKKKNSFTLNQNKKLRKFRVGSPIIQFERYPIEKNVQNIKETIFLFLNQFYFKFIYLTNSIVRPRSFVNNENLQRNKKICFFSLTAYPIITGKFEDHIGKMGGSELQQSLIGKELAKNQFDVSFIVNDNTNNVGPFIERVEKITIIKIVHKNFNGVSYLCHIKSLWDAMSLANADIYYQRGSGSETGLVALFCLLNRRKFIFALASDMNVDGTFSKTADFLSKNLYYFGLKTADLILTQSDYQNKLLKTKFNRDSLVIKNVISAQPLDPNIKKRPCVLWVGTIRPEWKQPEIFLDLVKTLPHINFIMIGGAASNSDFYENIKKDAKKLPNLEFLGFIPFAQINQYFAESSIFVNTSTVEGFPNTFLQAWVNSTPVVSLNIDPDELICNRNLGRHSRTFEEMVTDVGVLLQNEKLRNELGMNGRKYVEEEHDINVIIPKYIELLQNLG